MGSGLAFVAILQTFDGVDYVRYQLRDTSLNIVFAGELLAKRKEAKIFSLLNGFQSLCCRCLRRKCRCKQDNHKHTPPNVAVTDHILGCYSFAVSFTPSPAMQRHSLCSELQASYAHTCTNLHHGTPELEEMQCSTSGHHVLPPVTLSISLSITVGVCR